MKKLDVTGHVYGRLTAIRPVPNRRPKTTFWECRCECGKVVEKDLGQLRAGMTRSCGCLKVEKITGNTYNVKHGQHKTRTYASWSALRQRCHNPGDTSYHSYGGRGITVCERWQSYENFLADMGERPPGQTIDRIDVNGNYEPGNCRWATVKEQGNNRRGNVIVTLPDGRTMTLLEAARALGLNKNTMYSRWRKTRDWAYALRLTETPAGSGA